MPTDGKRHVGAASLLRPLASLQVKPMSLGSLLLPVLNRLDQEGAASALRRDYGFAQTWRRLLD